MEKNTWAYYNKFHLNATTRQMKRIVSHYDLYRMARTVPGSIVECGVFKGASLIRFAKYRELFGDGQEKKIIAFDTFDEFPEAEFTSDQKPRESFINRAGSKSIYVTELKNVFCKQGVDNLS